MTDPNKTAPASTKADAERAKAKAEAQNLKAEAQAEARDAKAAAADLAQQGKAAAKDAVDAAKTKAATLAEEKAQQAREGAASKVDQFASSMRAASDELDEGTPQARAFDAVADTLSDMSSRMRGKDLNEIVDDVSHFARQNPAMFLGAAALVGFAATRFLKASDEPQGYSSGGTSYDDRPAYQPARTTATSYGAATRPAATATSDAIPAPATTPVRPVGATGDLNSVTDNKGAM
ncbi:MAG: hypothetical protein ACU0BF_10875 [Paracoccaceae bacterium]